MTDILHRVVIETSPEKLYQALTEQSGLSAWWTKAETSAKVGELGADEVAEGITELVVSEELEIQSQQQAQAGALHGKQT